MSRRRPQSRSKSKSRASGAHANSHRWPVTAAAAAAASVLVAGRTTHAAFLPALRGPSAPTGSGCNAAPALPRSGPGPLTGYRGDCCDGGRRRTPSPLHVAFSTGPATTTTEEGNPSRSDDDSSSLPRPNDEDTSSPSADTEFFFPFPSDDRDPGGELTAGDVVNGTLPGGRVHLDEKDHGAREEELRGLVALLSEKIGSVDEGRVYHPELASGEVTRLFSNLKYEKTSPTGDEGAGGTTGGVTTSIHAAGSTLGAAALVAASTVGVGTLALPAATAPAGFLPTSAAMLFAWGYMVASGLLLSELALNRIGETGRTTAGGVLGLYNEALGGRNKPWAASMGNAAYFFLHYAVATACIAKGGEGIAWLLGATTPALEGALATIPGGHQLLFAFVAGLAFAAAEPSWVKRADDVAVVGMATTFLGIVGAATVAAPTGSAVDFGAVLSLSNQHPEKVVDAVPILFLSLVYQNIIPRIVTQLEGDRRKIRGAILLGTGLPAAMYLLWNAVVLGSVFGGGYASDATSLIDSGADPIALMQSAAGSSPVLGPLIGIFSSLAVGTSLVGVVRGLCDASSDVVGLPTTAGRYERWKPLLVGGIFVPPLAVCMASGDADTFLQSLNFGGAFGVSTLFLILPALLVWDTRYGESKDEPIWTMPLVPGGKLSLASLWKAAATLIVEQGAEKLGIIDWAREQISPFL